MDIYILLTKFFTVQVYESVLVKSATVTDTRYCMNLSSDMTLLYFISYTVSNQPTMQRCWMTRQNRRCGTYNNINTILITKI